MAHRDGNRAVRCEACWIGGSTLLLGGASLALSGLDPFDPSASLPRLGIAALTGFVLSWIVCPARPEPAGGGAGRSGAGDAGGASGEGEEASGDDGGDDGGDGGGDGGDGGGE